MGNCLFKQKGIPKGGAVIEIRSGRLELIEAIILSPQEIKLPAHDLYDLISKKSRAISKKKYFLDPKEKAKLFIFSKDLASRNQVIPLNSQEIIKISDNEKGVVLGEKNLPPPKELFVLKRKQPNLIPNAKTGEENERTAGNIVNIPE